MHILIWSHDLLADMSCPLSECCAVMVYSTGTAVDHPNEHRKTLNASLIMSVVNPSPARTIGAPSTHRRLLSGHWPSLFVLFARSLFGKEKKL